MTHQEKIATQISRGMEEDNKKQETSSKRVLTLRQEEMQIEDMKNARQFKGLYLIYFFYFLLELKL